MIKTQSEILFEQFCESSKITFAPVQIGGRHAQLIESAWIRVDNLRVLADLTQQLYLNMPSYGTWLEAKWQRRAARQNAPSSQVAVTPETPPAT